jgi:hypothetical protein
VIACRPESSPLALPAVPSRLLTFLVSREGDFLVDVVLRETSASAHRGQRGFAVLYGHGVSRHARRSAGCGGREGAMDLRCGQPPRQGAGPRTIGRAPSGGETRAQAVCDAPAYHASRRGVDHTFSRDDATAV